MIFNNQKINDCFFYFEENINNIKLPEIFTFPFNYEPHPICKIAAKQLQNYLLNQTEWKHDFGIDHHVKGTNIGKMFGVLVVRNLNNEIGFLSAFSGKLAGKNQWSRFVPPIVDLLQEDGFYRLGEMELNKINFKIAEIENSEDFIYKKNTLELLKNEVAQQIQNARAEMKTAKQNRNKKREEAANILNSEDFEVLKEKLKNESLKYQYDFKQLVKRTDELVSEKISELKKIESELNTLKQERKNKSNFLQKQMFNQYNFLNIKGEKRNVLEIFACTDTPIPPAGAGDCAMPKLLQYAFLHNYEPIAMAEFWWGQSPDSEIRKHGNFYPSCRSKCEPILGHMLKGMNVAPNPAKGSSLIKPELEVIYEDDVLVVINKPAEFLSVPGKNDSYSVQQIMKEKYPLARGPLLVHRLDMSTSGLIIAAKTKEVHEIMQKKFLSKSVLKRYVALLDGIVDEEEGIIDLPIRVDLDNRPRQLVCFDYGKKAVTKWQVIERKGKKTKINFYPLTGRTHQLRVHAAHKLGLHCPIVGDDLYGVKADRLYLHAEYLKFEHPITGKLLEIKCEAPF